jgi:hypothetical protein
MKQAQALAEVDRMIARLSMRDHLLPLVRQVQAGQIMAGITTMDEALPADILARILVPLAVIYDDRAGNGPPRGRGAWSTKLWLHAAYVAAGCTPVGSRLVELVHKHRQLLVIETTEDRAQDWAMWLRGAPRRKFAQLRAPGAFLQQHGLVA